MQKLNKKVLGIILTALVLIAILIGGLYFIKQNDKNDTNSDVLSATNEQNILDFDLVIKNSESEVLNLTLPFVANQTVFEALTAYDAGASDFLFEYKDYGGSLGAGPLKFNSFAIDESKEWWNFQVNGKMSDVGISTYKLQNGDKVEFIRESF